MSLVSLPLDLGSYESRSIEEFSQMRPTWSVPPTSGKLFASLYLYKTRICHPKKIAPISAISNKYLRIWRYKCIDYATKNKRRLVAIKTTARTTVVWWSVFAGPRRSKEASWSPVRAAPSHDSFGWRSTTTMSKTLATISINVRMLIIEENNVDEV